DPRTEGFPGGGVERLQGFLVPVGYEEGEIQEDACILENLDLFPCLIGNPDPRLLGVVRENTDLLTEYRPRSEGPSLKVPARLREGSRGIAVEGKAFHLCRN